MASTIEGFSTARPEGDHKKTAQSWRVWGGLSALTHEPAQQQRPENQNKNQTINKKNLCKLNNQ
jgi:hypothetical protein